MFKLRSVILYSLSAVVIALITTTVLGDAHDDCLNACAVTLANNIELAEAQYAITMLMCLGATLLGPWWGSLCALGASAALAAQMALLGQQAQECIANCPPPSPGS